MTLTSLTHGALATLILGCAAAPVEGGAFVTRVNGRNIGCKRWRTASSSPLPMGLYDEPLPDSLPDEEEVTNTDWDAELTSLMERGDGRSSSVAKNNIVRPQTRNGGGEDFPDSLPETDWDAGLMSLIERGDEKGSSKPKKIARQQTGDGVDDRPKEIKKTTTKEFFGTKWGPDDKYIPGKSNPRPVDDEPWFTG